MDVILQEDSVIYYYPNINYFHIKFKIVYFRNCPTKIETYSFLKQVIK